jgi:molybdopterin-guanine dinucleotide biosynthesis protein A
MAGLDTGNADRAAVVLCGGLSTRMGRPKALLPFGPEVLLVRVLRSCREACADLVVVAAAAQDLPSLPAGARVVRDATPEQGPLEGIAAGLAAVRAPAAFCVSCDVPFLRPALVERMFGALGDAAAVQAVVEGRVQPLGAVYRSSLAPKAARLVREGRRKVTDLVEGEVVRLLREPEVREADPDLSSFRNCNTPEEYASALRAAGWSA